MDAIAFLTTNLAPALLWVFQELLKKGVLEPLASPLKDWIEGSYEERKDREALHQALMEALDELRADQQIESDEKLILTLKLTDRSPEIWKMLAAAAVEMTDNYPRTVPPVLFTALGVDESRRGLLAAFLYGFRKHLAQVGGYAAAIAYSNDLDKRGKLAGITRDVAATAAHTQRLVELEEALAGHFGITTQIQQARSEYLEILRGQLRYLPMPLADPGAAASRDPELQHVFVPLTVRDLRAEAESRLRLEKKTRRSPDEALREGAEEMQPLGFDEVFSKYERFALIGKAGCGKTTLLRRAALAFAENRAAEDLGWKGPLLFPIFLRLRNFGAFLAQREEFSDPGPGALTAYLEHYFRTAYSLDLPPKFFANHLKEGGCLVLLDGMDEVSQGRSEVAQQVNAFIHYYGPRGNRFGLASRPRGYDTVKDYLRPAGLAECEVYPLGADGIRHLVNKLLEIIVSNQAQLTRDRRDLAGQILGSRRLTELASTPLFCTALTLVYKFHGAVLPERQVDVLEQIVDLLLGFWKAQEQDLAKRHELAVYDGTDEVARELDIAVPKKRRRLSYLAYRMQASLQKTEVETVVAQEWLQAYLEREERKDADVAARWASGFLRYAHEYSGLFVEQDLDTFAFTHEGFREYLAALEMTNKREHEFIQEVLEHIPDDRWEQVLLLAAAYQGYAQGTRKYLIKEVLGKAETLRQNNEDAWLRYLVMCGRMARDMDEYLPAPDREEVVDALRLVATGPDCAPGQRAEAADVLDELGWLPSDLYEFVLIPPSPSSPILYPFWIAKYPVTNSQYQRFVEAKDFSAPDLWRGFPKFDEKGQPMDEDWGEAGWRWLQENWNEEGKLFPRYWDDPRFGIARRGAPVVGVTWYEANAYCRWLLRHWDDPDLLEREKNPGLKPAALRLPTEAEWLAAAGGEGRPYPWSRPGEPLDSLEEVLTRANVDESNIGRTTPVGSYPLGASHPFQVMDLAGNVWEWQANFYNKNHDWLALRGGAWGYGRKFARLSVRGYDHPGGHWGSSGFRVVALPS